MEISKTTWWMIGGASVAVIGVGVFWFFNNRLKNQNTSNLANSKLGLGTPINLKTTAGVRQVPNWNNAFDMNYTDEVKRWLQPKSIVEISSTTAKKYAEQLKNAKGTFNDNEEIVKIIFSKHLKDKTNVSSISKAFLLRYKIDMWQHLSSFLSATELNQYVTQAVKQLPNYTTV